MCDLVNHSYFLKEDHLPDWVRQDKHGNKGDRVDYGTVSIKPYLLHTTHSIY
jgi:hypothetical protein